jgi:hypothetical protein
MAVPTRNSATIWAAISVKPINKKGNNKKHKQNRT